jgi:hypothetical protein
MSRPVFNRPVLYTSLLSEQIRGIDGNHAIYSTVVADEYTLRTPDALLNGTATTQIIKNCCPDIQVPQNLLICDIQHLLSSIKIATQGTNFEFTLTCPGCGATDPYETNLQLSMPALSAKKWFNTFQIDSLTLAFYPPTYDQFCKFSIAEFKLNKQLYTISTSDIVDKYTETLAELLEQKRKLQSIYHCSCIRSITDSNNEPVISRLFIDEWFNNCDVSIQNKVTNYIALANKACTFPDIHVKCSSCDKEFNVPLDLDFSNHFRQKLIPASEEEILSIIKKMGDDTKSITTDLLKLVWFMRGSISYTEAYNLTTFERKAISKIIEDNLEMTKKTGMPII